MDRESARAQANDAFYFHFVILIRFKLLRQKFLCDLFLINAPFFFINIRKRWDNESLHAHHICSITTIMITT